MGQPNMMWIGRLRAHPFGQVRSSQLTHPFRWSVLPKSTSESDRPAPEVSYIVVNKTIYESLQNSRWIPDYPYRLVLGQLPVWSGVTQPQSLLNVRSHFLSLPKILSPQGLGTLLQMSWRGLTARNPQGTLAQWPQSSKEFLGQEGRLHRQLLLQEGSYGMGGSGFILGHWRPTRMAAGQQQGAGAFGSQGPVTAVVDGCLVMTARQSLLGNCCCPMAAG